MKKDFNKSPPTQLRDIYALYYQQKNSVDELSDLVKEKIEAIKVLSNASPWSYFYEIPYRLFLVIYILEFNLADTLHDIANSDNQIQKLQDFIDNQPDEPDEEEPLTDEEIGCRFALVLASMFQFKSITIHSQPLSALIEKARDGNDEALFDAVLVDRSAVSAPSIAHRIQIAQLADDESFMNQLSKALTKTKPRRPAKILDDLRYMIEVIDEQIGLSNATHDNLYDILAEDLELYEGSMDGFIKIIQRRNKRHRT